MRLMRLIIKPKGELLSISGEFKSAEGRLVKLNLGPPVERTKVPDLVKLVRQAAPDLKELRKIGRV